MDIDRRKLAGVLAVAMFGLPLAECNQTQVTTVEAQITSIIQKVQSGVVTAVQKGCAWAGKAVPTAQTVMQEVVALMGSPVATVLAGTAASAIALIAGAVQGAIDAIAPVAIAACPPAPPTPVTPPAPTALAPGPPPTTAKGTPIVFY
jgi:hypothetical protein